MAINDIVQTIAEARVDARSLSEFVFKPAGFKVARRLAPTVDTLQFYIDRFNSLNGDFGSSVSVALSSLNSSVAEADGKVAYIETTVQDAINNTAVEGGVLADTFVTVTANGVDRVARTQRGKNSERVSFYDFGAIGNGIVDDTLAIRKTIAAAATTGQEIVQNGGVFYIATASFDNLLSDGKSAAILLTTNTKISGNFTIKVTSGTVTHTVFACDTDSQDIDVDITGVYCDSITRNRLFFATNEAVLNNLRLKLSTKFASIVVQCSVKYNIDVSKNKIGLGVTPTTPTTPTFVVSLPFNKGYTPTYKVNENRVVGGTEAIAGMFVIHHIPQGGKCESNVVIDLGRSGTEGFDVDGLGQFAHFSKNVGIWCGFEYKTSSGSGIDSSRDAFFHDNYSYEANTPFSIRSSCNSRGNIAYNPTGWGLYMGAEASSDPRIANSALCDIGGFTVIYAGAPMNGAVRIGGTFRKLSLNGFRVIIDPIYAANNPDEKLTATQGAIIHIKGDGIKDMDINDLYVDKSAVPQVLIRPETAGERVLGITLNNPTFGDCDVACIDAMSADSLTIIEPDFPTNIGDRAIKTSDCVGLNVQTRNARNIDTVLTQYTNVAATVNNYGISNNTSSGIPLNGLLYRVGSIVKNAFDDTYWIKVTTGGSINSWRQLAQSTTITTATTSELSSVSSTINTVGKSAGKDVYNTTTNKKYYAIGATATAAWRPYDAGADIVPV